MTLFISRNYFQNVLLEWTIQELELYKNEQILK